MDRKQFIEIRIDAIEKQIRKKKRNATFATIIFYSIVLFLIFFFNNSTNLLDGLIGGIAGGVSIWVLNMLAAVIFPSRVEEDEANLKRLKAEYINEHLEPGEIPFWEYE